jgi:2-keto-3-deoxy-L-rhamnonate aldolase RhmA
VDALMIGPNDLAASMGKLDQLDDAGVQAAIADVLAVGKANRMPMSLYCSDAGGAARAMEQGFTLLPVSTDNALIVRGARALVNALKNNQT